MNSHLRRSTAKPGVREVNAAFHILRLAAIFWLGLTLTNPAPAAVYEPSATAPPRPMREMRGAWIATVSNIDWPSTNTLTTAQQKAQLLEIIQRASELHLNTLIFQVRPSCDALYASSLEPWSEYLTGTMGKAPEPFYDPLSFAIDEAHKRGLELHAWFNPYRARHANSRSPTASAHVSRTKPHLVRQYGKALWLDPGEKEVQAYSLAVILDVVRRYDIDGVHIDDYFYPYPERDPSGGELDFPDDASWRRYGAGGRLSREDWRRENVNTFVHRLYDAVREAKPWVKVGVSPFGIWRPGNPSQIQGFDAYAKLYADSRKWLTSGWVDYLAPQLYWAIEPPEQSFPVLLKWWEEQNTRHRMIVPGMDSTKTARRWSPEEIVNQIRITRKQPGTAGHIHWNMKALMRNAALDAALARQLYAEPALPPALPRLSAGPQPTATALEAQTSGSALEVSWKCVGTNRKPWLWLVQSKQGKTWTTTILPASRSSCRFESPLPDAVAVTPVDRAGNLDKSLTLKRKN